MNHNNTKNICFIANYYKTIFYREISKNLEANGYNVYWICTSKRWTEFLTKRGVDSKKVLNLSEFGASWDNEAPINDIEREGLSKLENKIFDDTLRNIIMMDRLLKNRPQAYSLRYLLCISEKIRDFLISNNIKAVFSEKSWAHEVLIGYICKDLEIFNLNPQPIRIPSSRFAFFDGITLYPIQHNSSQNISSPTETEKALRSLLVKLKNRELRPNYFVLNQKVPFIRWHWLKELYLVFKNLSLYRYDETVPKIWMRIQNRIRSYLNFKLCSLINPFDGDIKSHEQFVLLTLHKQPEASIDISAPRFSNQMETIRLISRALPSTHTLAVKEHSNALGDRSLKWYRELKKIPGVRLIGPFVDSFSLIENADLVISASGTACLEAALLGKPAITFADVYFGEILTQNNSNPSLWQKSDVESFMNIRKISEERRIDFLKKMHELSFPGIISGPVHDPSCMTDTNLSNVSAAFNIFLNTTVFNKTMNKGFAK